MPVKWGHESADLLVARINGKLAKPDIGEFQAAMEPMLQASGNIKFLVILEDFEGWEAGKGWEDNAFADANDQFLSRFAIVGDERWRDKALMSSTRAWPTAGGGVKTSGRSIKLGRQGRAQKRLIAIVMMRVIRPMFPG